MKMRAIAPILGPRATKLALVSGAHLRRIAVGVLPELEIGMLLLCVKLASKDFCAKG